MLLAISYQLSAQEPVQYIGTKTSAVKVPGRLYVDSTFYPPQKLYAIPLRRGAFAYDSATGSFKGWNGTAWTSITGIVPVTSVFARIGAITAQSGDYNTSQVSEVSNLYFTNARARTALSATGSISYNSSTGVFSYTTPAETDPVWSGVSSTYRTKTQNDALYAALSHSHAISDVTGLQSSLDLKVPDSRTVNGHALSANVTVTKSDVGLANADNTSDINKPVSTAQQTALDLKVDKITGQGLSTNDYTTAEQTKLAGIAAGATANSTDAFLLARANHTGVQAATTITEDATHRFATDAEKTTWNAKQAAITTGTTAQYFRGDLSLTAFPTSNTSFTNGAGYLVGTNNLSDISNAGTARTNLGFATLSNYVDKTVTNTYTAGAKQIFGADATNAGVKFAGVTANPSSLAAGDLWYRSDENKIRYYDGTTARALVGEALAQTLTNKTIAAGSNTITGLTNSNLSGSAAISDANISSAATWNAKQDALTIGAFNTTSNTTGGDITAGVLTLRAASASNPGGVTATAQTFGGAKTFSGITSTSTNVFSGGFSTNATIGQSNLASAAISTGGGIATNTTAGVLFGGATTISYRNFMNGNTSTTLGVSNSFANLILGKIDATTAASGTHAVGANLAVLIPTITTGTAGVTDFATTYIQGAPTGGTNNWALYIAGAGNTKFTNGNLTLGTAGNKLFITEGTNASVGSTTLVSGTVTVTTSACTSSSRVFVQLTTAGGTLGAHYKVVAGSGSFVLTSVSTANATVTTDTSSLNWWILN